MGNPFEDLRQAVVVRPMNSPGPQGAAAPHMKIRYSADGVAWHNTPVETDKYLSFSTDNGITWSDAIYFNNLSETLEWVEKARQWAENPEGVEVEPGQYSALHHKEKALDAQIAAETSEANALVSATNAAASAGNALTSAENAATSEANAKTSEINAATSEANASASANNAAISEANASASANNAAISEANASASANNAAISEANASASEGKAAKWAENPEDDPVVPGQYSALHHKEKALDAQVQADISAANALNSANNAAMSAANALASENKAEKWAQEDEDVEVEPGKYSAYHWAQKAEDIAVSPLHGDEAHTEDYIKEGDPRLTNARMPIEHASTHTDGTDNIQLATSEQKGLMSDVYAAKLDGIEENANNYVHPATHSLDMITETDVLKIFTADERDRLATLGGIPI